MEQERRGGHLWSMLKVGIEKKRRSNLALAPKIQDYIQLPSFAYTTEAPTVYAL